MDENADPAIAGVAWLELPGTAGNEEYVQAAFDDYGARNYSYNYDRDMFTSLWVAYPLYSDVMNGSNSAGWKGDPNIPDEYEIKIHDSGYGVNYGSTTSEGYDSTLEYYARGHQIPNADRTGSATMNSQTYYVTNSTPQIQNGFNGGIWSSLETAVRNTVPSGDTLYVVTGASFAKAGETKNVTWILPQGESKAGTNKKCPVPNYYWKAILKVTRDASGCVTGAKSIGFWLDHKVYSSASYVDYAVSVDQIEEWTGFDLFVNLPDSVENAAETNSIWNGF